ncbi:MAG TPA: hypothetical protein VI911_06920 [Patescibacteria group bacterium]|nr:hypothetical protein [Patescibacteria group bacterium]
MSTKLFLLYEDGSVSDIFKNTPNDLTKLCLTVSKEQALKEYLYWVKTRCSKEPEGQTAYMEHSAFVSKEVNRPDTSIDAFTLNLKSE